MATFLSPNKSYFNQLFVTEKNGANAVKMCTRARCAKNEILKRPDYTPHALAFTIFQLLSVNVKYLSKCKIGEKNVYSVI